MTSVIHNERRANADIAETSGHQGISVAIHNHIDINPKKNQTPALPASTKIEKRRITLVVDVVKTGPQVRCTSNHSYYCKIINGKEELVSTKEDTSKFDVYEDSPKVSLATITCIKQTYKGESSKV